MIRNVSIREIERRLTELRAEATAEERGPSLRTSVMTHIAWVPEEWIDAATRTLGGLEERHPSRTILLFPRPDEDRDELDGDVDLRCFVTGGGSGPVCFEVVQIALCGTRTQAPASVVAPLLVSDLPVFLRWRGPVPFGSSALEELVAVADRLVVDSAEWRDVEDDLERLPELFDEVAVSDIAWARLEPWRRGLARLWPGIAEIGTLHVAAPRTEALLLAGWLGGRLGRDVELVHEGAEELERVEADGEAVDPVGLGRKSASDLLSDQLDLFARDPVYEEAVRSFSRVAT